MSELSRRIERARRAIESLPAWAQENLKWAGGPKERDLNKKEANDGHKG